VVVEESTVGVTALGEVRNNGRLVLKPPAVIGDALAVAGGLTEFADESAIFVLRGGQRIRFTYDDIRGGADHARRFLMANGDTIVVE
jgi:protein involved in polysaccharide export with SLBB domain